MAADGEARDVPFATELGRAVGYPGGFAVGALAAAREGTKAVLALVGTDGASGRVVDLGLSHGAGAPPRIAARGRELYLVVSDSDASGGTLRIGVVRDPRGAAEVTWGAELAEGWDPSQAFDVVVGPERGVVVWDRWTDAKDGSMVVASSFDLADVSSAKKPERLSLEKQDAENPRLVARPGGSWLVYVERTPDESERTDAGVLSPTAALDEGLGTVVDLGRRSLLAVPLDREGKPVGAPRRVSPQDGHVIVFDLAPATDGGLELVWRDDATSPGVEGGELQLALLRPDGSIQRSVVQGESIDSGAPSLVFDTASTASRDVTWLAMEGVSDSTQLLVLGGDGRPRGKLREEAAIGRGDVLTRYEERLLIGTPRGRSVELTAVRCQPGHPHRPHPDGG